MAKESYKIPASLNEDYLNMEIALQNKDGMGLKPLAVRVILIWIISLFGIVYLCINENSIIAQAGFGMRLIFAIVWLGFTYVLTQMDKSHRMQIELIPTLLNYLQASNRVVITRKTANANGFYGIVGIDSIDKDSGLVKYIDGTYAYWYSVVGTASVLLFPEDQAAILDRVNEFYKKLQPDAEVCFVTTKEAQKVAKQLAHLMAQYKILEYKDRDIDALVKEQYDALKGFVGTEFKSLHQYMVIKGDNRESLSVLNNIVISEYENSSLMLKECVPMYAPQIDEVMNLIYA